MTDPAEKRRLARLRALAVLDTGPEPLFDAIVRTAAQICDTPIALISLIDEDRQWFKANLGLESTAQTPRAVAFCDHAIRERDVMEIDDATADPRFRDNPLVTGAPHIRFYAGAPITMSTGEAIGTVCVIDREPRHLDERQVKTLANLAEAAAAALAMREKLYDLTVVGDEARFPAVGHSTTLGIFQAAEDGPVFHTNARFAEVFGLPAGEAVGHAWLDRVHPDDRARVAAAWAAAIERQQPFDQEFRLVAGVGGESEVRMQSRPATWGEPLRNGHTGVVADITSRKRMEQDLRRINSLMRAVVDELPCGLSVFDEELNLVLDNRKFRDLLGFPDSLFPPSGAKYEDFIRFNARRGEYGEGVDEEEALRTIVERARTPGGHVWRRYRPNGMVVEIRGAPMIGGGIVMVYVDITEQEQAQRALNESEERQKRALDATGLVLWEFNGETGEVRLSENWAQLMGLPRAVTVTTAEDLLASVPAEHRQPLQDAFVSTLTGETDGYATEHPVVTAKGETIWILSSGQVTHRGEDGRVLRITGTNRDITRRKAMEDGIRAAKEAAEQASRAKTEFLSTISHEIRTPLNGVLGMLELLQSSPLRPEDRERLDVADTSARQLLELINDLLDIGKIEAGQVELEALPTAMPEFVEELASVYGARARAKGLEFVSTVAPETPRVVVCDPVRVRQVMGNLLSNAIKFTERGRVTLHVEPAGPSGQLAFSVKDSGIGLSKEGIGKLFKRFSQADSSTTRKYGGTGLGLSIVKQLAELMGGRVEVRSTEGEGSTFTCLLPLPASDAEVEKVDRGAALPVLPGGLRILVAEDNPVNQVVVRGLLGQLALEDVTIANDGAQAVQLAKEGAFDVLFMDCLMPVMDGYQATRELRAAGYRRPIVALTANASASERDKCMAAGMDGFVTKPVSARALADAVLSATGARPQAEAPAAPAAAQRVLFDRRLVDKRMGGHRRMVERAMGGFVAHTPELAGRLRDSVAAGDAAAAHLALHSLRGSCAMLDSAIVAELAGELEEHARNGDMEAVRARAPELLGLVDRLVAEVDRSMRDSVPSS
jgi:PAS domain S-box-containing protein